MLRLRARAMGTEITVAGSTVSGAARIFEQFNEWEQIFSRFLPQSELSRVNGSGGKNVHVSAVFLQVLWEAVRFAQETDGLFSPFLGRQMRKIGYAVSFDSPEFPREAAGTEPPPDAVCSSFPCEALALNLHAQTVRLPGRLELDLGGYAKGAAVDAAAEQAQKTSPCGLIDAGGDMRLWQDEAHPFGGRIGVEDPLRPGHNRLTFRPQGNLCIATSSICRRRWRQGGIARHHLIDPRTGVSARTDCLQATVFSDATRRGEVYAKCAVLYGAVKGAAWMDAQHPECAYLLVGADGTLISSPNLNAFGTFDALL